ncbi:MAG TPA: STAS domain-containing protein [bacterium]|nr:STAS domain-containing protein [bacterium]
MRVDEFKYRVREVSHDDRIVAIDLEGGIFISNIEDFRAVIETQFNRRFKDVILNFSNLDFISSMGIGVLVKDNEISDRKDLRMWIVSMPPEVRDIFNQFSLHKIMRICETEQAALEEITRLNV